MLAGGDPFTTRLGNNHTKRTPFDSMCSIQLQLKFRSMYLSITLFGNDGCGYLQDLTSVIYKLNPLVSNCFRMFPQIVCPHGDLRQISSCLWTLCRHGTYHLPQLPVLDAHALRLHGLRATGWPTGESASRIYRIRGHIVAPCGPPKVSTSSPADGSGKARSPNQEI